MIKPEQQIKNEEGDAEEFIEIVNKIMGILIFQYSIKEVVFVKIENWFDHKWLKGTSKNWFFYS
jgi:virulence-associated protein VapD